MQLAYARHQVGPVRRSPTITKRQLVHAQVWSVLHGRNHAVDVKEPNRACTASGQAPPTLHLHRPISVARLALAEMPGSADAFVRMKKLARTILLSYPIQPTLSTLQIVVDVLHRVRAQRSTRVGNDSDDHG